LLAIADVPADESVASVVGDVDPELSGSRVGEPIVDHDLRRARLGEKVVDQVRADETCPAGNEVGSFHALAAMTKGLYEVGVL
jgi:hypothetical protein